MRSDLRHCTEVKGYIHIPAGVSKGTQLSVPITTIKRDDCYYKESNAVLTIIISD